MITGVVWVCDECGSDNVEAEAYAVWNVEEQQWRYDLIEGRDDRDYCYNCDDRRFLISRKVNLQDISKVVIRREEANAATAAA
jgi:hypothetical protein